MAASAPGADTVNDGTYPLSRTLYIYPNTDKVATSPALKAFVDYYLSDAGIKAVTDVNYIALPDGRARRLADHVAADRICFPLCLDEHGDASCDGTGPKARFHHIGRTR